jgi:glycosyltransferase involved in cell wall biosynthesis
MRILHFIKGLGRGGAEMLLVHALRYADREHFEYEYAYMLPHKDALVADLQALGAPVHLAAGRSKVELLTASWRLAHLVRERDIDLIHAHLPVAGMVARFAGVLSGRPVVYTEHNLNQHYSRLTRLGNRLTWRLNSSVVACSAPVAESIAATMPRRAKVPVRTILNGIDVEQFADREGRKETREALGIPMDAPVTINVAVFRQQKRLDLWLEAAERIVRELPEAHFILVGDGPLRAEIELWRRERGLDDRVYLPGLQEDVRPFLAAADLFLLTSDFEGLPLAVIEGMAAGLPVVATRAGGVPDLVGERDVGEDEVGGVLVNLGDVLSCVTATVALFGDAARREVVGQAARARVRHHFGVERMVQQYEEIYRALPLALQGNRGK